MANADHHIGQRLSLKGQLCTVRYFGPVADKPGQWLGVEWDDPTRGKHDGTHGGRQYFACRNHSRTAASFLNPKQPWDTPRTFLQALREKYMSENAGTGREIVYFSSKQAEEVGFEKFSKRQKQLQGIHVVVLDQMRIAFNDTHDEGAEITRLCNHITELDLGSNLFETSAKISNLIPSFPKLSGLTLDGNRFSVSPGSSAVHSFRGLKNLALSDTLLNWQEISWLSNSFPDLISLSAAHNGLTSVGHEPWPPKLEQLVLSDNPFTALSDVESLASCRGLKTLVLKRCSVSRIWTKEKSNERPCLSETIQLLDLRENAISSWTFFSGLDTALPRLRQLQISGNPLYRDLTSAQGKPLTSEDGYMLTIARIPQLETLNYSTITDKERLNAETYYLSQIAAELSRAPPGEEAEILSRHPRWKHLCSEYGEPVIEQHTRPDEIDPNGLAARLITFSFFLAPGSLPESAIRSWEQKIPKSFNVYSILGTVGKKLGVSPMKFRLVWESEEEDPVAQNDAYSGPEWWDSSDENEDLRTQHSSSVSRAVELIAGTRPIGTYIEGRNARIRVEQK